MRALIQRVQSARIEVDKATVSQIGPGLLVLVGFCTSDTENEIESICQKVLNVPVFDNHETGEPATHNVMQKNHELLVVSQFTLYGVLKGNRMDFHDAMPSERAKPLYDALFDRFCQLYDKEKIKDGIFGVKREVYAVNNGPIAFQIDTKTLSNE